MKNRLVTLARKHLSPTTKKRIRRVRYALLGRRAAVISRSGVPAAKAAFDVGRYDEATAHVERVLRANPFDLGALDLAARLSIATGEFTQAGVHATVRAERSKDPKHWGQGRKIVGRTRETDPRWQPFLATASEDVEPSDARVLYLAKESRPFLHNGFCTRSHETLQSLVRSGWDVFGVTMPGFPGPQAGEHEPPTESRVEDVTYEHLLPGAGTVLRAMAHDEYVELTARALAGVVRRERPALLHVASGHRGFESALAGNAVAEWARIPWLYEVRSFFETTWTADPRYAERGEYYERRFATESRMMRAANLVVTLSGPMRDEIIERHG
ncbi:MAG TPA: glycosyltransferase, partial [Actinopolymorphaceae bacterium]